MKDIVGIDPLAIQPGRQRWSHVSQLVRYWEREFEGCVHRAREARVENVRYCKRSQLGATVWMRYGHADVEIFSSAYFKQDILLACVDDFFTNWRSCGEVRLKQVEEQELYFKVEFSTASVSFRALSHISEHAVD